MISKFEVKEIEPVFKTKADQKHHLYERSRIAICGASMSGKTTLMMREILFNQDDPPFKYSMLYIASSTINSDSEYLSLQKKVKCEITCYETFNEFILAIPEILKNINDYKEKCKKHKKDYLPALIIIDDMVSHIHESKELNDLFSKVRHYSTICVLSQSYISISPFIRKQLNLVFITVISQQEFSVIGKELLTDVREGYRIIKTLKKYQWIRIVDKKIDSIVFKPKVNNSNETESSSDSE